VRLEDERAWLSVKGERSGIARPEFEYPVPQVDAEAMLKLVCDACLIRKTRHDAAYARVTWEIDEYEGVVSGTILAEVELDREDQVLTLQPWIGREVTGDSRFRQFESLKLLSQVPW
jgi:CYTH domain-containing protein